MKGTSFVGATAEEALARVQERMGEDAVVLGIRQVKPRGLRRLWEKARVEVVACEPESGAGEQMKSADEAGCGVLALGQGPEGCGEGAGAVGEVEERRGGNGLGADVYASMDALMVARELSRWPSMGLLAKAGFTPMALQRIAEAMDQEGRVAGGVGGMDLMSELSLVRKVLSRFWRVAPEVNWDCPQVLMGPLGSGKTTALSKWMAQLAMGEGRQARVVRLDGATANTARILELHAEMLGVPVVRSRAEAVVVTGGEVCLVDVPGVDWREAGALHELRRGLDKISGYEGHLVLNGAYEIGVLLAQVRAFEGFPIRSLWITHLDEETRWSKLWNLAVLTSLPMRHGSAGQNVPGDLWVATEEMLGRGLWPAARP